MDVTHHGYHRQCYKKFTNAVSVAKRKSSSSGEQPPESKRPRRSGEFSGKLFPDKCMICGSSGTKKVKGERQKLKIISTEPACKKIKLAANLRKDDQMLLHMPEKALDLNAQEFKMHEKCYKDYTRVCSNPVSKETNTESTPDDCNNFEILRSFVQEHIIDGDQSLSIKLLTELYGFDKEDSRLRNKVKKKLEKEFGDRICFVSTSYHEAEVVINRRVFEDTSLSSFVKGNEVFILKEAATVLRKDITEFIATAPDLVWPPTVEALTAEARQPPDSLITFLINLLHSSHHSPGEDVMRYVSSFAQDVVHAVSRGQFLTAKHILLGAGLHSLTGQKLPIKLLARYGNACSYEMVQKVETAQAELVQNMRLRNFPLGLVPASPTSSVLTFFWWDNFDCKKETIEGSIHTCHGVAFQENSNGAKPREELATNTPISGRKTVSVVEHKLPKRPVKLHKEPPSLPLELTVHNYNCSKRMLFLWKLLRFAHSTGNQSISRFVGWVLLICGTQNSSPTILTFLPPILQPITDYSTITECIFQSQKLSKAANMTYTHITIDGGAASKFYHVLWNNPEEFKNVIIHLGDFHGLQEFFGIIGKIIQGSGFEEIVYQAGLCTSGGLKGVLSGKHYNRSWLIHECFAEAIERLFVKALLNVQNEDIVTAADTVESKDECQALFAEDSFVDYEMQYNEQVTACLNGQHGKTAQFWTNYVRLVDRQHQLHYAINTNNFDERLQCWEDSLKLCFSTNKQTMLDTVVTIVSRWRILSKHIPELKKS